MRRSVAIERLEDRRLLAIVAPVLTSNDVVFSGDATNDQMSFSVNSTGLLQHNRGGSFGFASNLDLDSVTPGEQARLVREITSFRYHDAGENDRLYFNGPNPFSFGDASVDALAGEITVSAGASIESTGGLLRLVASQKLLLNDGSSLTTVDGGISLSANPNADAVGDFVGLESDGASIRTTGEGDIELVGFGGNDVSSYLHHGILLGPGTTIESQKGSSPAGTISINGTGGDSSSTAYGVYLNGADIVLRSAYGDIRIEGQGGYRSNANGSSFHGVNINSADLIESTGTGPEAATITIEGTGGVEARTNYGVQLRGATTDITSIDGDIRIVGQGGGDGTNDTNYGVYSNGLGSIASTGTSVHAATITIIGDGGSGTRSGNGLALFGAATQLTSAYGDISIIGRGAAEDGYLNWGASIGLAISSTGEGENAATISIDGTGGINSSGGGASVSGSISTIDGDVLITGTGTSDGSHSGNVGASVSATIVADGVANVTIDGQGASGVYGVALVSNADLTTTDGAILIRGQSGDGNGPYGVFIEDIQGIESKGLSDGTNPSPATITITGTAGTGSSGNNGVYLNGASKGITSVDGAISITGHAEVGSSGVSISNFGTIRSTGTTAQAATITIHGEGGTRNAGSTGVAIGTTNIESFVGDISITGTGGTGDLGLSTSSSRGVSLGNVDVASLGTTENATGNPATITIDGIGGNASRENYGTNLEQSAVSSVLGSIDIRGEGGSTGFGNTGVRMLSTELTSTGEGSQAATISLSSDSGVSASVTVSTIDGDASFLGLNGSSSSASGTITSNGLGNLTFDGGNTFVGGDIASEFGDIVVRGPSVYQNSGQIQSTGTGSNAAILRIGDESTHSIRLNGDVSSVNGDIEIKNNITDASTGAGYVSIYGDITSTGIVKANAAKITIEGTGADGQTGVYFRRSNQIVSSVAGDISITGRGGNSTGNGSRGVFLSSRMTIESTGTDADAAQIVIHGTGGAGVNDNTGVYFYGDTAGEIRSVSGAISITGIGGAGTGRSNAGVYIRAASISSTGTTTTDPAISAATITINGTGGDGTSGNDGVELDATISSRDGAVLINGTGGSEGNGVILSYTSSVTSSGEGSEAATLTVDGTAGRGTYGSGVYLNRPTITSVDGAVSITGRGSEGRTIGLDIYRTIIESTGMGEHAATIDLIGIGGEGDRLNFGIEIDGTTAITSVDGDITIDGTGGNSTNSSGTYIRSFDTIASLGTSANAAQVTIKGSSLGAGSHGVVLATGGGQRLIKSNYGDISITGQASSIGVYSTSSQSGGSWQIVSAGEGADAANITIEGNSNSTGVGLVSDISQITTIDGDISITGSGIGGVATSVSISSTGMGSVAGHISIAGTGTSSIGSSIRGPITTTDGDITITGSGDGDRSHYRGVDISSSVASIGTGANAGLITIIGITAADGANGVHLDDGSGIASNAVTSVDGDIEITGATAGGSGSGVYLHNGVSSTGTDKALAAQIVITGSGGTNGGRGVYVAGGNESNPNLSTAAGDVLITGTGGSGSDSGNRGVWLRSAYVDSTGSTAANAGKITIEGIGGSGGVSDLIGVDLDFSETKLVSVAGDLEIIATAGFGSGTNNVGLRLAGTSVIGDANTTGDITLRTDSIDLQTGAIQSKGALTIAPKTDGTSIGLGGGAGDLNLDDAELALLADGFESLTIGGATAGTIDLDSATFTDDVIISGSTINDHTGTDIDAGSNTVALVGTIAPGQSPGILNLTGDIVFADDSVLGIEINGSAAGETATNHDQIGVVGTFTIGANVQLLAATTNGFEPTLGHQLVIVQNDGSDPISGEFDGLPEGTILSDFLGLSLDARISYLGLDETTGNDVVLTIIEGNQAPLAHAGGPYAIDEGDPLNLDASASSDPDEDPLSYAWDLNGDGDFSDASGAMPTVTWAELVALGIGDVTAFDVTLSVDDGRATAVTDSTTVNVVLNEPPTADAGGPYVVDEGGAVTLDANRTSDDKGIGNLTIEWDLDGDGIFGETGLDALRGDETELEPVFSAELLDGTQVVSVGLRVEDDRGRADIDTTTVSVRNVDPTITLASSTTVIRDDAFTLAGSFTDPGPDSWTATVNYADGSGNQALLLDGKDFQLNHVYETAGVYTAVVTIDDGSGGVTSNNVTVIVELPPLADLTLISADVSFSPIKPSVGDSVTFVADVTNAGSIAANNVPVSFQVFDPVTESFVEIGRSAITSIDATSEVEGSLTWDGTGSQPALPSDDAYLLVRVEVDPDAMIEESDEANNGAIQVLQVGSPDFGSATLVGNVSPFTTTRGAYTPVGGQAYYDFDTIPGSNDFPVQNASVTARLIDASGQVLRTSGSQSAPNGNFLHFIRAPEVDGVYTLRFEVNEGTLNAVFETTLTVEGESPDTPPRPRSPAGPGYVFSPSIQLTQSTLPPGNPQIGEPVTIIGSFDYELELPLLNVPVTFNDLFPVAGQLRTFEIGNGFVHFPDGGLVEPALLPMQWTPTAEGYHIVQVIAEPEFEFKAHTRVTQLVLVGDLDTTSLNIDYEATILPDPPAAFAPLMSESFGLLAGRSSAFAAKAAPLKMTTSEAFTPGDTLAFTLSYENTGTTTITGGMLIDDFDETLLGTPTHISDGGIVDGNTIRWKLGDIAPGTEGTVSYEVTINSGVEFPPGSAFVQNIAILNADQAVAANTSELTVSNNAPVISTLDVSPVLDENGDVTLTGTFSDASSADTHTINIDWGNGQSDTLTFNAGERSFAIEYSYGLTHPPQVDSYSISVSITDDTNQSVSGIVTTQVPASDETSPSSSVLNATADSSSGLYDIQVNYVDPTGSDGLPVSGVESLDIYYRVNPQSAGSVAKLLRSVSVTPTSASGTATITGAFDALPGDVIQLWSVATDGADNVETEVTPRTDFSFFIADTVGPETQVDSADFDQSAFIDLTISGTDVGGGHVNSIEVYVETNPGTEGSTIALVGTVNGGATAVAGQLQFAVPQDGVTRDYRFFSIGTDHLGNREGGSGTFDGDPGSGEDILLTNITLAAPASGQIIGFDANDGLENRSSIHSVDIVFNDEAFIEELLASLNDSDFTNDRIRLERMDLAGNPIGSGEFLPVSAVQDGLKLRLDFGAAGLPQNGVYAIRVDMDEDTTNGFEELLRFHRLQGDINGDGVVDTADLLKVRQAYRNPALHPDADVDGDGDVDRFDLTFFSRFLRQTGVEKQLDMQRDELND